MAVAFRGGGVCVHESYRTRCRVPDGRCVSVGPERWNMISTESGAGSPILRARRARYLGIYRDLTRWRRFLAEYSGSAGLRCCPVVRACSRWTPRHTGLFQRSRQERQGKCSKARRSPYIIRQMPDAITTLPLARTDSSTLYPCPTPDRVDSTLSDHQARPNRRS